MNTRERVLKEALNCVNGEREKQYGNPEDNFKRIADLWSVYLTSIFEDVVFELDPIDVAKMMILFKIARANGPKDKLDNYVDIIGYAACAAEIFENSEAIDKVSKKKEELGVQLADECKECDYDVKCIGTGVCLKEKEKELLDNKDPYSYAHDKLANYVETKAKEEHVPLDNLKSINRKFPRELSDYLDQASTDCVMNGKRFLDCFKEIDELFAKYKPDVKKCNNFWEAYENISEHITSSSSKANVHIIDVVDRLTENRHDPTEMAALLWAGKLGFDDVASYVDDAINEVKKETK